MSRPDAVEQNFIDFNCAHVPFSATGLASPPSLSLGGSDALAVALEGSLFASVTSAMVRLGLKMDLGVYD